MSRLSTCTSTALSHSGPSAADTPPTRCIGYRHRMTSSRKPNMYCCVVALTFSRVIFAICGSVRSKSIHSGVVSMVDLLEESLQIRLELVPQLDVRDNHGRVLLAIRPPLVVTCVRILHIALPRSKCSHKRQQRRPLEPPHVQLAILGVSMLELHGAVGAAWNPPHPLPTIGILPFRITTVRLPLNLVSDSKPWAFPSSKPCRR